MRRDGWKYEHVLGFALEHPWAVTASMRSTIAHILARRISGDDSEPDTIALVARANRFDMKAQGGSVAVIPIYGVIAPRMNLLSEMSGGTTFEALTAQLHEALALPDLSAIVFDVDSPGGNVAGASEFAREVLKARTKVPIYAQAQYLCCSAAYWPMACATEIIASPSAMIGSIGVYAIHDDVSAALDKIGIKRSVFSAGKFKAEGADGGALTEEAAEYVQRLVDSSYARMVGDIAKGRGCSADAIRSGYGEGRTVNADDALRLGMVDAIATLSDTLARLTSTTSTVGVRALTSATSAVTAQEPATVTAQGTPTTLAAFERELYELELKGLSL
jgi:signal peptide peptidase SppA